MGGQEAVTWIWGGKVWVGGSVGSRNSLVWDGYSSPATHQPFSWQGQENEGEEWVSLGGSCNLSRKKKTVF